MRPVALDFGAIMAVAAARQVDLKTLAEILPRIEAAIINPADGNDEEDALDGDA